MRFLSVALLVGLQLFLTTNAFAGRYATVGTDEVAVYEQPNPGSKTLETLKKGAVVGASNLPIDGYHKVRTRSGFIGWVAADTLRLDPIGGGAPSSVASNAARRKIASDGSADSPSWSRLARTHEGKIRISALGGLDFFSTSKVVSSLPSLGLSYNVGGEFIYMFSGAWGLVLRGEYLFNKSGITDLAGNQYQLTTSSIPILTGIEYSFWGRVVSFHVGLLGGIALPSSSSSAITSGTNVGATTTLSANHFTAMLRTNLDWRVSSVVSLYLEGGYRYAIPPAFSLAGTTAPAAQIFQPAVTLDMSGPWVGFGVGVEI